jgi:prefoldin subunit 5
MGSETEDRYLHLDQKITRLEAGHAEFRAELSEVSANVDNMTGAIQTLTKEVRADRAMAIEHRKPQLAFWVAMAMGAGSILLWVVTWGMAPLQISQSYISEQSRDRHEYQENRITAVEDHNRRELALMAESFEKELDSIKEHQAEHEREKGHPQLIEQMFTMHGDQDIRIAMLQSQMSALDRTVSKVIRATENLNQRQFNEKVD